MQSSMKINVLVHWHGTANDSGRSYCLPARRLNVPYNANTPFAKQVGQVRVAGDGGVRVNKRMPQQVTSRHLGSVLRLQP